jgi:class 3 adenylate cyclase
MSVPALAYAARHPERLIALFLNLGVAKGVSRENPDYQRALTIARMDWEAAKRLLGGTGTGWQFNATVAGLAEMLGLSSTQEAYIRWHEAVPDWDATEVARQVTTPTLISHMRGGAGWLSPWEDSRKLATMLPDAQFVDLTTESDYFQIAVEFLAGLARREQPPTSAAVPGLRTLLFTDIVGHTDMMQRLGDAMGRDVLREHERITRETLKAHGGTEVKTMGDGFMASFGSVAQAMECAIALQRAFAARNDAGGEPLSVRVGLNAGEPIEEDGDLFGATVIMASRVCGQAGAGEILIPEPVRHLLAGKPYVYADRGETMLKGFEDAVRLHEVRWQT